MALLLFVRSIDDVMPAVEAANEFLAYKQNLERNRQSDDLRLARSCGIWTLCWIDISPSEANTAGNHRAKRLSGRWQRFCLPTARLPELGRFSRYSE